MGILSSARHSTVSGTGRSIMGLFLTRVVTPVVCLVLLWGVLAATAITGTLTRLRWLATLSATQQARIESAAVAGAGLIVVIVAILLMSLFSRLLAREIFDLTGVLEETNHSAASAASAESRLRHGLRGILVSLAKRNQALLHRQLRVIDDLEQQAASPAALADLFTLDHLTTRMRRNAENLTILSGEVPSRSWSGPVPVIDVIRAAAAEVEDYTRVTLISDSTECVAASAVTDMIHLLAELIENATLCSPSSTRVEIRAGRVANGFAIEIEDRGLGMPAEQLKAINAQLADPPDFDLADPDRLGLFVAGKLAARHGAHVSLSPSPYLGIRAVVVLPDAITDVPGQAGGGPVGTAAGGSQALAEPATGQRSPLNLRAAGVLSLAARGVRGDGIPPAKGGVPAPPASQGGPGGQLAQTLAGTPGPATTRNGLPRRVRPEGSQGSPAHPSVLGSPPADDEPEFPLRRAPAAGPAPEEARSLAASLQNSWQRSRRADGTPDVGAAAGGLGQSNAGLPDSEEA
jgi:signal transduction histidine kinase